ncbi:putative zinc finger protein [Orchesella cincta]|uniref:Putative zinc finger protein n=1 Tax=Orchesella cincta TaxID=48709 RepID=A0A1D2MW01_ORCCI|nr:putative zinc finger protein [Orchesella cincta]
MHPKALRRHKHLIHNQSGESNKCPKCEVCFASPKTLWDHYHNVCSIEETVASLEELESRRLLESVKFGNRKAPIGKEEEEKGCRDGPFACEHCGSEYTQKATRDAHVRRIHMNQRFICDICDKEEPTGGKLWRHKVTSHPEVETPALEGWVCEYCSKPVLRNYQQHVEKFHPKKLAEFKKKGSYIRMTKGDTGRSMTKCPECEKEIRADRLRRHLKNVHGHGLELRPCQYCKKEFKTNSDLNDHIRTMHEFESFERKVDGNEAYQNRLEMTKADIPFLVRSVIRIVLSKGHRCVICSRPTLRFTSN